MDSARFTGRAGLLTGCLLLSLSAGAVAWAEEETTPAGSGDVVMADAGDTSADQGDGASTEAGQTDDGAGDAGDDGASSGDDGAGDDGANDDGSNDDGAGTDGSGDGDEATFDDTSGEASPEVIRSDVTEEPVYEPQILIAVDGVAVEDVTEDGVPIEVMPMVDVPFDAMSDGDLPPEAYATMGPQGGVIAPAAQGGAASDGAITLNNGDDGDDCHLFGKKLPAHCK